MNVLSLEPHPSCNTRIIRQPAKLCNFNQTNYLLMSLVCSIILWMHTDDAMKPLKCMSVSFQWVLSKLLVIKNIKLI